MLHQDSWYIAAGAFLILVVGGLANWRARRESARSGTLSTPTRALMMVAFGGLGACIIAAAVTRALRIDLSPTAAAIMTIAGAALIAAGAAVVIAVFAGSRKRTWDVDTDRLVTRGVYGLSRNPRAVGWFAINLGLGLAIHSAAVIALAALFLVGYIPWILLEETVLERHFGAQYRDYTARTPRFLRLLPRPTTSTTDATTTAPTTATTHAANPSTNGHAPSAPHTARPSRRPTPTAPTPVVVRVATTTPADPAPTPNASPLRG